MPTSLSFRQPHVHPPDTSILSQMRRQMSVVFQNTFLESQQQEERRGRKGTCAGEDWHHYSATHASLPLLLVLLLQDATSTATTVTVVSVMMQCSGANYRLDVHLLHTESDLLWLPVRFSAGAWLHSSKLLKRESVFCLDR